MEEKMFADFQRILAWLLLSGAVGYVACVFAHTTHNKVAPANYWWNSLTLRQKWIIGTARAMAWTIALLAVFSPIYLEFPNVIGDPVVATVERDKLVYHPYGLFDPPWNWGEREIVTVSRERRGRMFDSLARDNRGKAGLFFWGVSWEISDVERFYTLPYAQRNWQFTNSLFRETFVDAQAYLAGLNLADDDDKKSLCQKLNERFVERNPTYPIRITADCDVGLNTEPDR
jgi:hypothetical protein